MISRETVMIITIAVYVLFIAGVAIFYRKSSKNITELTVGGRNAGAWVSAFSYGTAYFSALCLSAMRAARAGNTAFGVCFRVSETPLSVLFGVDGSCEKNAQSYKKI